MVLAIREPWQGQPSLTSSLGNSLMFSYRPPKGNCWGHSIRPKDPASAKKKVNDFLNTYFEPFEPEWDPSRQLTLHLNWRNSVLPNTDWPEEFLKPENEKARRVLLILTGDRIMFMSMVFPISHQESASYEFLGRFASAAPFKMSAKHFQVGILRKNGKLTWRKPDNLVSARLQEFIA